MGNLTSRLPGSAPAISPPAEVREVAEALIRELGDNLTALLWHGSWARGEQTAESDHDLIVVVKQSDESTLLALQDIFRDRGLWSTYIKTDEEMRQLPATNRLQFHHGFIPLYGEIRPPDLLEEGLREDVRRWCTDVLHEARYRIVHGAARVYRGLDADFARIRNARWMYYQAKMVLLALKSREMLRGERYAGTRAELRARLTDPDEIAVIDTVTHWPERRAEYEADVTPLCLLLERLCQKLIHELEGDGAK